MTLRDRIARLYQAHPRGAKAEQGRPGPDSLGQSWLAREAGVDDRTVRRWVRAGAPSRYGALVIERLEREAGLA